MATGIPCFQYVSQTDAVQNYVQLVGLIWMQFNTNPNSNTTDGLKKDDCWRTQIKALGLLTV